MKLKLKFKSEVTVTKLDWTSQLLACVGRSMDICIECSAVLHLAVYIYDSNHEQRIINVSYCIDSAIAPDSHSAAAAERVDTSSVLVDKVALAALPTVDGSLEGPRVHCAKHAPAQYPRYVVLLPQVQR